MLDERPAPHGCSTPFISNSVPRLCCWDRLNTHGLQAVKELIAARDWLTVSLLPAYAPELNPVEGIWSQCKRSMANPSMSSRRPLDHCARVSRHL